jgi:ParB family chromosome partitioning protein
VTRDLFGTDHQVSDPKLVKTMAAEKLKAECAKLVKAGWSFAVTTDSVRNTRYDYTRLKVEAAPTPEEVEALSELNAIFNPENEVAAGYYACDSFAELTGASNRPISPIRAGARDRPAQLHAEDDGERGLLRRIDDDGFLEVEFGHVKPKQKEAAAKVVKEERKSRPRPPRKPPRRKASRRRNRRCCRTR